MRTSQKIMLNKVCHHQGETRHLLEDSCTGDPQETEGNQKLCVLLVRLSPTQHLKDLRNSLLECDC